MAHALDADVGQALEAMMAAAGGDIPSFAVGDVAGRRAASAAQLRALPGFATLPDDVQTTDHTIVAPDGAALTGRWFTRVGSSPGSAVYYIHGGGMIAGSMELYHGVVATLVSLTGVPALSIDYRLAPEHPDPVPVTDCYAGLRWTAEHAADLGFDPGRLIIAGDSAGGGLAAGTALLARDHGGPALAAQVLIYPMLDDRTTVPDPAIAPFLTWDYDDNVTGWSALLGDTAGTDAVSAYAAPARATDLSGLPPTYIDVGDLDVFRTEDIVYAGRLAAAGVPVELHVHPGAPHGFEAFAPAAAVSRRAMADRVRVITSV